MNQNLVIQYGNPETEVWETIVNVPLKPNSELYPELPFHSADIYGIKDQQILLPNGEEYSIEITYSESNLGLSMVVFKDGKQFLLIGGFKSKENNYDPNILFSTSGGFDVQVMVGPDQDST